MSGPIDSSSRYWTSGPEVFDFFRADEQITPSAEDFNSKWQVDQIRGIEEEIEEDTFEAATEKQEDSPGSSGTDFQILHASNREEERSADSSELKKDFRPEYAIIQEKKSEDTTEAGEPEPDPKEKKEIIDPLPVEKQRMRSVANIHEEKSDDPSIKERKSKDTTEADEPESEPKEKKGIINPLPVKKQMMRSMSNIQEEESDDASIKERKSKDTIEADEPEPKENIIDSLSKKANNEICD